MTGKNNELLKCEKIFEMISNYDVRDDVLYFHILEEYSYKESLEIDNNIIIDFDENNIVVAMEILNASKVLKVSKFSIMNILKWSMIINITEDLINIDISTIMLIRQKKVEKTISTKSMNNIGIPVLQNAHFNLKEQISI